MFPPDSSWGSKEISSSSHKLLPYMKASSMNSSRFASNKVSKSSINSSAPTWWYDSSENSFG
ncbi:UNVERIFIED_CONTAM: hypothetical protein NCL1_46053 [Trichonephila clavipes]